MLKTVHAEDGVRLAQKKNQSRAAVMSSAMASSGIKGDAQDVEMNAPVMDFIVKDGRRLERAETSGPPQIVITQPGSNQKTVVTAAKFTAKFTEKNRLATLHGEPDAKIVSSKIGDGKIGDSKIGAPGQLDRVSTSQRLDFISRPQGAAPSTA